jgi:UDP-N-acetylbacillosamine N-acetyltransferase
MTIQKVVVWGTGGQAMVVADVINAENRWQISGFLRDPEFAHDDKPCLQDQVLGGEEQFPRLLAQGIHHAFIAVGNNKVRLELAHRLKRAGFSMISTVHPSAVVSPSASIGEGVVLMAGAILNPGAIVGDHVIVNTGASVDHECELAQGVHICPGAHLAGHVGSSVIQEITIGSGVVLGAGSVVVSAIPDNVLAMGVPARIVKSLV